MTFIVFNRTMTQGLLTSLLLLTASGWSASGLACELIFKSSTTDVLLEASRQTFSPFVMRTGDSPVRFQLKNSVGVVRGVSYLSFVPRNGPLPTETMVLLSTDGQSAAAFSATMQERADSLGKRLVYFGVDSSSTQRTDEYVSEPKAELFIQTEEFYLYLRNKLSMDIGLSDPTLVRFYTFGYSNGSVFALQHALKYPDLYHGVIALSVPRPRKPIEDLATARERFKHMLIAFGSGTDSEERMFRRFTDGLQRGLRQAGLRTSRSILEGGRHSHQTWKHGLQTSLTSLSSEFPSP